jgi:hypothetical protein
MPRGAPSRERSTSPVPSLRIAEEGGGFATDGIEDRTHVVHPRLEVRKSDGTVGEPRAALVEADQARERREPLIDVPRRRMLPVDLEVREETMHEHEIEPALRPCPGKRC